MRESLFVCSSVRLFVCSSVRLFVCSSVRLFVALGALMLALPAYGSSPPTDPGGSSGGGAALLAEEDLDGDGIPDSEDNCPPAYCERHGLDPALCFNPNQVDSSGDGIGDACNVCLTDLYEGSRNSNTHAEIAFGAPQLVDVCDPVPLLQPSIRVDRAFEGAVPPQGVINGEGPQDFLGLMGTAIMGQGTWQETYEERVGFRFCGCYDILDGSRLPDYRCGKRYETCDPRSAQQSRDDWISVPVTYPPFSPDGKSGSGSGGSLQTFHNPIGRRTAASLPVNVTWRWYEQATRRVIPSDLVTRSWYDLGNAHSTTYTGVYGYLATAVESDGTPWSDREQGLQGGTRMRVSLEHVDLPRWKAPPGRPMKLDPDIYAICLPPACGFPFDLTEMARILPSPVDVRSVGVILPFADGLAGLVGGGEWYAADALFSPGAAGIASRSPADQLYLPAAEPLGMLRAKGVEGRGVALDRHAPSTPAVLAQRAKLEVEHAHQQLPLQLSSTARAAYSAVEHAIFSVEGQGSDARKMIVRDLATGNQTVIQSADLDASLQPLALTYDARRSIAYLLDVSDEGNARVLRVRTQDGTSEQIWSVPYSGQYKAVTLGMNELGTALYMAAGSNDGHVSWQFDLSSGTCTGALSGPEMLLDGPIMGTHDPVLMLVDNDLDLVRKTLEPGLFTEEIACDAL